MRRIRKNNSGVGAGEGGIRFIARERMKERKGEQV